MFQYRSHYTDREGPAPAPMVSWFRAHGREGAGVVGGASLQLNSVLFQPAFCDHLKKDI